MNALLRRAGWILLCACPALVQADSSQSALQVRDAWIRAAPPGAAVLAGFVALRNDGESSLAVSSVTSPDFDRIEIHEMSMHDGVMRMRRLSRLEVEAQGEVTLAPGGMHLMLFGPGRVLSAGDRVALVLHLDGGADVPLEFVVRPQPVD